MLQLDRQVDLMAKRRVFLLRLKEFQIYVKNTEEEVLKTMRDASCGKDIDMERIVWFKILYLKSDAIE